MHQIGHKHKRAAQQPDDDQLLIGALIAFSNLAAKSPDDVGDFLFRNQFFSSPCSEIVSSPY